MSVDEIVTKLHQTEKKLTGLINKYNDGYLTKEEHPLMELTYYKYLKTLRQDLKEEYEQHNQKEQFFMTNMANYYTRKPKN